MKHPLDIAVVTDEIADSLAEALDLVRDWGITRVELREGGQARYPDFTPEEVAMLEAARRDGVQVTAVSPGLFKGSILDAAKLTAEMEALPKSLELANRLGCPTLIVFGFERFKGEGDDLRPRVVEAFRRIAETVAEAGMSVIVENEPKFWVDLPEDSAAMVRDVAHPAFRLNWDPANLHWGGVLPTYEGFRAVRPYLGGLHVKDYYPTNPFAPWCAVGEGTTPWAEILRWAVEEADLTHVTLETHAWPRTETSRRSLDWMRARIAELSA
ncbi:MAG TPA: sugar phosphate isomerase/epimerase family protein [Rhodothermales bacterium]|nr:sugar phosphate isomerase/epimerase family protein [Rhodothermales bacterium]